jgi:hypothetical protein
MLLQSSVHGFPDSGFSFPDLARGPIFQTWQTTGDGGARIITRFRMTGCSQFHLCEFVSICGSKRDSVRWFLPKRQVGNLQHVAGGLNSVESPEFCGTIPGGFSQNSTQPEVNSVDDNLNSVERHEFCGRG